MKRIFIRKLIFIICEVFLIYLIYNISFSPFLTSSKICIFENFFNIPCPGCGMIRAFHNLIKLDFKLAFKHNPLIFIIIPIAIIFNYKYLKNKVHN